MLVTQENALQLESVKQLQEIAHKLLNITEPVPLHNHVTLKQDVLL